ncbi:hypothetical protein C0036_07750, partial [Streptomyces sp. DJ]
MNQPEHGGGHPVAPLDEPWPDEPDFPDSPSDLLPVARYRRDGDGRDGGRGRGDRGRGRSGD